MNKRYHFIIQEKGYGKKMYKKFKHDLEYRDGYFEKVVYTLLILFIFCLIMVIIL